MRHLWPNRWCSANMVIRDESLKRNSGHEPSHRPSAARVPMLAQKPVFWWLMDPRNPLRQDSVTLKAMFLVLQGRQALPSDSISTWSANQHLATCKPQGQGVLRVACGETDSWDPVSEWVPNQGFGIRVKPFLEGV